MLRCLAYDDKKAYLVDTKQQGTKTITSLESLALARNEKGPMSSRNKYYIFEKETALIPIETAILKVVRHNSETYLNPPIKILVTKELKKQAEKSSNGLNNLKIFKRNLQCLLC